jgi:hypothetical protein
MNTYVVDVSRTGYGNRMITVAALNEDDAKDQALEVAGNYEYSEHDADYSCQGVVDKGPVEPEENLDERDERLGKEMIEALGLELKNNGRVDTEFGDKTPMGFYRTMKRITKENKVYS